MSKPFTRLALATLSAALLMTAQGCVTVEVPAAAQTAETTVDSADPRRGMGSLPEWRPEAAGVARDVLAPPAPKVRRGNGVTFEQAVAAMRAGRLGEAETLLQQLTADQPELAGPWVNLGQVYVMLEKYEAARLAFTSAIMANPRSCAAYNQLGVLSRQVGDFHGAEQHYRRCLDEVPNFKDAYLNLGILYELYLGRLPEALEAYRRYQLLAAEPDHRVRGWVVDLERRLGV